MGSRSWKPRRPLLAAAVTIAAAASFILAGCSEASNNGQNALKPKGHDAQKINNLFVPILIIASVIGIAIIIATIYFALKFRYRTGTNDNPKQIHGNTRLEIGWTIVPALLLAVVAVPTISTIFDLSDQADASSLEVTVVGKQWWWQFEYTDAKVVTADELVIPAGRKVHMKLKACEADACNVIHSFWVPELSGTKDVVPGRTNDLTLTADKPGTFLGQCKEYCGLSHANMRFRVIAKTADDFEQWISEQQQGPAQPLFEGEGADAQPAGAAQTLIAEKYQCTNCHSFDDSSVPTYGPNLTHLASRDYFASATFELNKKNLVDWVMNAPQMIPMQTGDPKCRPSAVLGCVGMPSFVDNVPKGQPKMSRADAEQIADFLLEQQ